MTDGRRTPWRNTAKDLLNCSWGFNFWVSADSVQSAVVIQEVDVDAVLVVLCADRGDGGDGFFGLPPGSAGHATAVVDEKDRVECF